MKKLILAFAALSIGACSSGSSEYRDINEYEAGVNEAELTRPRSLRYSDGTVLGAFEKRKEPRYEDRNLDQSYAAGLNMDAPRKQAYYNEEPSEEHYSAEAENREVYKDYNVEAPSKQAQYEYRVGDGEIPVERDVITGEPRAMTNEESPYLPQKEWKEVNITPDVYKLVATRATNRLLDETSDLYEKKKRPTLYVKKTVKNDPNLPDGFYEARLVTQDIIAGTKSFILTDDLVAADYVLETSLNSTRVRESNSPVVVYRSVLLDRNDAVVKEFNEALTQTGNGDRSWW